MYISMKLVMKMKIVFLLVRFFGYQKKILTDEQKNNS